MTHNVLPNKVLYLVRSDLCHWFCLYPLHEALDGDYQILNLPYRQRERPPEYRFPMCGKAMGCKSISVPLEVPYASLHASDTACIARRILHNPPSVKANKTLRESPWKLFRPVDLGRLRARPQPLARDSFTLVTCGFLQRRTKGRPSGRLHSDAQVSQQETPKTLHLHIGAPCMAL